MSQTITGSFPIDPTTTSGTELAGILNDLNNAVLSMYSGTSRPAYAVQGFSWLDITSTLNAVKFYTGSTDLSILEYNTLDNIAQINGGTGFADKTRAIKNKVSATTTVVPTPAEVQAGEILINTADKIIYFKDAGGLMVGIAEGYTKTYIDNNLYTQTEVDNLLSPKLEATDYATSTVGGTVKARLTGTDLYLTIDGSTA